MKVKWTAWERRWRRQQWFCNDQDNSNVADDGGGGGGRGAGGDVAVDVGDELEMVMFADCGRSECG